MIRICDRHFHIVMGVSGILGMFAGIYHWFPKMYGRYMNNTMALYPLLDHFDRRLPDLLADAL